MNRPSGSGNFTTASFKGQYAFSMSGKELCNGVSSFFTRAGSITADGLGNITGGVEDVNVCSGVYEITFSGGSYQVRADGRGSLSLTNSTGTTSYSITLASPAQGFIIQTDASATTSGSLRLQDPAAFSLTKIAGSYVFDVSGISATLNPLSVIGRFTADGAGGVQNGLYDSNEAGTLSGQQAFPAGASYQLDATYGSSGRGLATLAGRNFVFYIVDASRIVLLGTDFPSALVGEASAQQNLSYSVSSLSGNYVFQLGGASATGAIVSAGRFTSDGAGNLSAIVLDENSSGTVTALPGASSTISGGYTVDANALGGGTLTWTDSAAGTFTYIFYLASPTRAVFQETDSNITSDGLIFAQNAASVTASSMAGNHAFGWTGVTTDEVDATGQFSLSSTASANASGLMDFNAFSGGVQYFDVAFSGGFTLGANPAARNTLSLATNSAGFPPSTFKFSAYLVDSNTVLLVGTDSTRVLLGTTLRQP
ncbi:MAG: hypothetical protein LAN71_02495 [Acidobacteriia bacterium]|nr:hypothetical protein [Terriglobia bacterium]